MRRILSLLLWLGLMVVIFPGKMSAEDTIVVTGNVPAKGADFQLELTADKTGNLSVGDEVIYQINYGSYLSTTIRNLVISAEWSRGTVSGSPVPSVDIADYVVGSGTSAWGGVEPVIDPINRRISWTISSFPANTADQTVKFKLVVNDSYSGSSDVTYTVEADLGRGHTLLMSSSLDNVYHPAGLDLSPTPTEPPPTSTPSVEPTSTVAPTPTLAIQTITLGPTSVLPTSISTTTTVSLMVTPTLTAVPLKIQKIEVVTLSDGGISISSNINVVPKTIKIVYGQSLSTLDSSLTSISALKKDLLKIDGLKPDTDYYFRIVVTDNGGNIASSDIYTFKTAESSEKPEIDPKSLLVSSADNILLDAKVENSEVKTVVLVSNQSYALRVNLTRPEIVKSIRMIVLNSQVLGINTIYGAEPNSTEENLVGTGNGEFIAHLVTPTVEGFYDIIVRIEDTNGNISEEKIGAIRVMAPLLVVDENDKPVENAKVMFYRLNQSLKTYELIGREMFGFQNPSYSDSSGQVVMNFPKGEYRIGVSRVGYVDEEINFNLGLGENEKMPIVILRRAPIGFFTSISYYGSISSDVINFFKVFLYNLTTSSRFFKLTMIMTEVTGVIVLWVFTANYYSVFWWLLPKKLAAKIVRYKTKEQSEFLRGRIINEVINRPVNKVKVYLLDDKLNKVLSRAITDSLGDFRLEIKPAKGYRLAAVKDGYEPTPMLDFTPEGIKAGRVNLRMKNIISAEEKIRGEVGGTVQVIGGWLWSLWLWWLVVIELIFWRNFGFGDTWWGVMISLLSLGWWLTVILKKHEMEKA